MQDEEHIMGKIFDLARAGSEPEQCLENIVELAREGRNTGVLFECPRR
jgi:hypothetical protein